MSTILSVNNYNYARGGAETVYLEQNRLLQECGWQVVPFCMKHPRNVASGWDGHFVEELEFGEDYGLLGKLRRASKVVYSIEARRKLDVLLDEVDPDICHAHNIYHHISPSILSLLRSRSVPVVLTLHDLKLACPAYKMLSAGVICEACKGGALYNVVRKACVKDSYALSAVVMIEAVLHKALGSYTKCVDRFVVPSRFYIRKFVEWGFPESRFRHVPNFVDGSRFVPQFRPGPDFVYFGRLSSEKGVATLLRAAAATGVRVRIIGTGPEEGSLKALSAALGCNAEFLGHLGGDALQAAVRSARAVVVPSEWYENAPMSVLEAYALGKPVIGADIGGIPELVLEGRSGRVFRSGDAEALGALLVETRDASDSQVADMGVAAHAWVNTEFTAGRYRERILALYGELGVGGTSCGS